MSTFQKKIKKIARDTNQYLNLFFNKHDLKSSLLRTMTYGLFSGGKKLR